MSRADHTSKTTLFTEFTEARWQAIRLTRHWPDGVDWRREIEGIGRDYWEAQAARDIWVKKLRGKQPAKQRDRIRKACLSMRQSQKALAGLVEANLLDDDFSHPDLDQPQQRLDAWLSDYDVWVRPFAGQSNPIQAALEWRLIDLWKKSGGKADWSRKKDDPGTPYGPLVNFLTLTIEAILGKALRPAGIAKMIDRHRGRRPRHNPYLMYSMHLRITGMV